MDFYRFFFFFNFPQCPDFWFPFLLFKGFRITTKMSVEPSRIGYFFMENLFCGVRSKRLGLILDLGGVYCSFLKVSMRRSNPRRLRLWVSKNDLSSSLNFLGTSTGLIRRRNNVYSVRTSEGQVMTRRGSSWRVEVGTYPILWVLRRDVSIYTVNRRVPFRVVLRLLVARPSRVLPFRSTGGTRAKRVERYSSPRSTFVG